MSPVKPLTPRELDTDLEWYRRNVIPAVTQAHATTQLAADFRNDELRAATTDRDGGRSSDHPDPTGAAATNTRHDPTDALHAQWVAAFRQHMNTGRRLANIATLIGAHADHLTREHGLSMVIYCANRNCGEAILEPHKPRRGRCQPCANYLDTHDLDAPSSTVKSRQRVRKHREGAA